MKAKGRQNKTTVEEKKRKKKKRKENTDVRNIRVLHQKHRAPDQRLHVAVSVVHDVHLIATAVKRIPPQLLPGEEFSD